MKKFRIIFWICLFLPGSYLAYADGLSEDANISTVAENVASEVTSPENNQNTEQPASPVQETSPSSPEQSNNNLPEPVAPPKNNQAPSTLVETQIPTMIAAPVIDTTFVPSQETSSNVPLDTRSSANSQNSPLLQGGAESRPSIVYIQPEGVVQTKNFFGEQPKNVNAQPVGSMQFVWVGKILSIDRAKRSMVVRGQHQKIKTIYVDARVLPLLRKGSTVQMTFRPGSSYAETIQPILGA